MSRSQTYIKYVCAYLNSAMFTLVIPIKMMEFIRGWIQIYESKIIQSDAIWYSQVFYQIVWRSTTRKLNSKGYYDNSAQSCVKKSLCMSDQI